MNLKHTDSAIEFTNHFNAAASRQPVSLHHLTRDQPDYWTALMSAFLVVCMLAALAICSWQIEDWKGAQTATAQPAVASGGFSVNGQHTF